MNLFLLTRPLTKGVEVPNFDENSTHIRPITIPKMPVNYDS